MLKNQSSKKMDLEQKINQKKNLRKCLIRQSKIISYDFENW